MVLWSRQREETDSYNQGIGWDIPLKLFLIFEGNRSICLQHVLTGTLPQEKALPVVVVQFSFTKFPVAIVWAFWLNSLPFKTIFVELIDFDRSESLLKGLPLQWTQDAIHSGKSCHSNIQNPIIREFWSFPFRIPVAFGLCLPRTQGEMLR